MDHFYSLSPSAGLQPPAQTSKQVKCTCVFQKFCWFASSILLTLTFLAPNAHAQLRLTQEVFSFTVKQQVEVSLIKNKNPLKFSQGYLLLRNRYGKQFEIHIKDVVPKSERYWFSGAKYWHRSAASLLGPFDVVLVELRSDSENNYCDKYRYFLVVFRDGISSNRTADILPYAVNHGSCRMQNISINDALDIYADGKELSHGRDLIVLPDDIIRVNH